MKNTNDMKNRLTDADFVESNKRRNRRIVPKRKKIPKHEIVSWVIAGVSIIITLFSIYEPKIESKVIRNNKPNGKNQIQISNLPYVKAFCEHLHYIEGKDTANLWNYMSNGKKRFWANDKMNMLYSYFLTYNYDVRYIIPIEDNHFYVFMDFTDDVDIEEVTELKKFSTTCMDDVIKYGIPNELVDEIYAFISNRFTVTPICSIDSVKNYIRHYLNNMSMKTLVTQDWRFPVLIAAKLNLPPNQKSNIRYTSKMKHTMIAEVHLFKENEQWIVDKFETIAISRWN